MIKQFSVLFLVTFSLVNCNFKNKPDLNNPNLNNLQDLNKLHDSINNSDIKIKCLNKEILVGRFPKIDSINYKSYQIINLNNTSIKIKGENLDLIQEKIILKNLYSFNVLFCDKKSTDILILKFKLNTIILNFNKKVILKFMGCNFINNNPHYFFEFKENQEFPYFEVYNKPKSNYIYIHYYANSDEEQFTL